MRTYHTHFGVPTGSQTGRWDDETTHPTQLFPLTCDKISLIIFHALYPESDSVVTSTMSSCNSNNTAGSITSSTRIFIKSHWHCVQDEDDVLLDCTECLLGGQPFKSNSG